MMVEKGIAYSFQELGNKFIEFLQKSNSNTQAWELLDSRLSSFYGATLKIPLKYATRNGYTPCYYLSIQHTEVTQNTYADWLRGTVLWANFDTPYTHSGAFAGAHYYSGYLSETYDKTTARQGDMRAVYTKYGTANRENLFKNTGEFLAFGLHTAYDENLAMCEQGGITCERETRNELGNLNFMAGRSIISPLPGRDGKGQDPYEGPRINNFPVFPGTGCPWLTISDQNKLDWSFNEFGCDYWFTKYDYHATITIRMARYFDSIWQSIEFGKMDLVNEDSNIMPLYIGGGNQALSQDIYVFTPVKADCPTYTAGNVYDLDATNICLSNSNILHASKFNGANMSNFRVKIPSGEWVDIYYHSQTSSPQAEFDCRCHSELCAIKNFINPLNEPIRTSTNLFNTAFPHGSAPINMIDTYTVNEELNQKVQTQLDKVIIALDKEKEPQMNGLIGSLPNVYSSWSLSAESGEIELNGIKYLFVPNGWDDRLWYYPTFIGALNNWTNTWTRNNIHNRISKYGTGRFRGHLVIPLEEGD